MITVDTLQLDFIQQADHTGSEKHKDLSTAQRDYYLNKSKNILYEIYSSHIDNNDRARRYLSPLIVRDKKLSGTVKEGRYQLKYPDDLYKPLRKFAMAKKGNCSERKMIIRQLSSDKIDRALANYNISRFWDFEEMLAVTSSEGVNIYLGDLSITGVHLDYLAVLEDIASPEYEGAEAYIDSSGAAVTTNKHLNIDDPAFAHEIVACAVLLAQRDYGEIEDFQAKLATITNIERVSFQ